MKLFSVLVIVLVLLTLPLRASAEDCVGCHEKETPGAVAQWRASAHVSVEGGCSACHGEDHEKMKTGKAVVDAARCGRCHEKAFHDHAVSRHGIGLHTGWGCTRNQPDRDQSQCSFCHQEGSTIPKTRVECSRFLKQSQEMGELGCNRCHQVESNCATCHGNHLTDLAVARDPSVCARCHMGPDHPQWEVWETSMHGTLWISEGEAVGPSCQRCHMPQGSHNVSQGLTMTPGMKLYDAHEAQAQRDVMVKICSNCHASSFSRRELEKGDAIRKQSLALVKEAEEILWDLNDRNLLSPSPDERPPHPLRGEVLVTDGQMLYEDISHIERLFFKMKKYDLAKTVKGAYHQNPAYTHWLGNAELKMDLVDIRSEAQRLRERKGTKEVVETTPIDDVQGQLDVLKKRFERGAIDDATYASEKAILLQKILPKE